MNSPYQIIVKPDPAKEGSFILFNEASGAICGDRLYKGDDEKNPKGRWPFRDGKKDWVHHDSFATALLAKNRLQEYLDFRHKQLGK